MTKKAPKTRKCKECGKTKSIEEFKVTTTGYTKSCKKCISNKRTINKNINNQQERFYIYKFTDEADNVLYVGQTTNIENRMAAHLRKESNYIPYSDIYSIEYTEVESDYHMNIYEVHYICKYKPKGNIQYASKNQNLFDLPDVEWDIYIFKDYLERINSNHIVDFGFGILDEMIYKLNNDENYFNEFLDNYKKSKYIHSRFN